MSSGHDQLNEIFVTVAAMRPFYPLLLIASALVRACRPAGPQNKMPRCLSSHFGTNNMMVMRGGILLLLHYY
jgi:hypothetical protein